MPAADRGKFTAFDVPGTAGRNHLQQLASAGLTPVHILPPFDIATVRENPADRVEIDDPVAELCAKNPAAAWLCVTDAGKTIRQAMQDAVAANQLDRPQQIVEWIRDFDGFNWGYDPLHFGVPEGSYSTDPNGAAAHPRVPSHGQGPERARTAHDHGRGLQPHQRVGAEQPPCSTASCPGITTAATTIPATSSRTPAATTRRPSSR